MTHCSISDCLSGIITACMSLTVNENLMTILREIWFLCSGYCSSAEASERVRTT